MAGVKNYLKYRIALKKKLHFMPGLRRNDNQSVNYGFMTNLSSFFLLRYEWGFEEVFGQYLFSILMILKKRLDMIN